MSVSNPYITELKGWTRKLTECPTEINDDNNNLQQFCESLEKCFQNGVLMPFNTVGFPLLADAWLWLSEIHCKNLSPFDTYSLAVEQVKSNAKVDTSTGRLRLLIRTCLTRKCLHTPVEILVRTPLLARDFYDPNSILGDDILGEILLSVLFQSSKISFKLNLRNSSFLDDSWELPDCTALDLVPCKSLGISVCFVRNHALIVNLENNSVAAEDEKIKIGDVLDEINECVITSNTRAKLRNIMRKASGRPVSLHIVKHNSKGSNEIYEPIARLIRCCGIESVRKLLERSVMQSNASRRRHRNDAGERERKCFNAGFSLTYCGSVHVGAKGDVKQIEQAILNLVHSENVTSVPVKFECLEIGIRVTNDTDQEILCKQSYMEISSCGRTANVPDHFAFIAGNSNCNVATKFDAYVFYHENGEEVQTILQSLAQGFQRTHFAV